VKKRSSFTRVDSGATATYVYNAEGRRVQKTTSSGTVEYVHDLAGRVVAELNSSGAWTRGEVYAGGQHLATYASDGWTYFVHTDWLGNERARSTVSGASYETCPSLPFGDWLICSGGDPSPMHFTGDEFDAESDLHHTWFRQYSSSQAHWLSPDPAGSAAVDPTVPQTWNRYAYVLNAPTELTDPLGLWCVETKDGPYVCFPDFGPWPGIVTGANGSRDRGKTGGGGTAHPCIARNKFSSFDSAMLTAAEVYASATGLPTGFGVGGSATGTLMPGMPVDFGGYMGGGVSSMLVADGSGNSYLINTVQFNTWNFQTGPVAAQGGLQVSMGGAKPQPGWSGSFSGGASAGLGLGAGFDVTITGAVTINLGVGIGAKVSAGTSNINVSYSAPICKD
jgi:RHS repeat-associated protein